MSSSSKLNLMSSTAVAADTNGSSNLLPLRASKLIGHITTANTNAATTVTAYIQHSPDGTNWYNYISFDAIAGTNTSAIKNPSTNDLAVFPFVRASVTLAGATKLVDLTIDVWFEHL